MDVFKEGWKNYKSLWTAEKYACFKGRASRREYWTTILIIFITELLVSIPDTIVNLSIRSATNFSLFSTIYGIAIFLPALSLTFRRLHDVGRSGWWIISECIVAAVMMISLCSAVIAGIVNNSLRMGLCFVDAGMISLALFGLLLAIVCFSIQIIVFVFTLLKGQTGPNKYGEAPVQYKVVILSDDNCKSSEDEKCECSPCCCQNEEVSSVDENEEVSSVDENEESSSVAEKEESEKQEDATSTSSEK